MYLADTEEGGETVFPNIPAPGGVNEGFSECAKYHLAAKPKKGSGGAWAGLGPCCAAGRPTAVITLRSAMHVSADACDHAAAQPRSVIPCHLHHPVCALLCSIMLT